jgi:uncharacterized protein
MASGKEAAPMRLLRVGLLGLAAISIWSVADVQQIQINKENKTIAITTSGDAEALADTAVLTVGFHIYGKDQDGTYADASKASNAIMDALKSAGVANERVESTEQSLSPLGVNDEADKLRFGQGSRFEFSQSWSVTLPAAAVANVLHVAITAGANDSGSIQWRLEKDDALEAEAAKKALEHARQIATQMAEGLGVKLGALVYASNQTPPRDRFVGSVNATMAIMTPKKNLAPLAISPERITKSATVYAVFAIE